MNQVKEYHKEKGHSNKNRVKLLELGCYNGRVMQYMVQQMIFVSYTGVDVTQKYLAQSPVQRRKDVTLLCEDVTKGLSVADGSQDMIISSEVLEHINPDDLPGVIQTLYNKIKTGGRICVAFPMNTREKMYHDLSKEKGRGHVNFPVYEDFSAEFFVVPLHHLFLGGAAVVVGVAEGGQGTHLRHPAWDAVVFVTPADHNPPDRAQPGRSAAADNRTHGLLVDDFRVFAAELLKNGLIFRRKGNLFA